jgi:hypothetical protein
VARIANAAAGVREQLEHQSAGNWCRGGGGQRVGYGVADSTPG